MEGVRMSLTKRYRRTHMTKREALNAARVVVQARLRRRFMAFWRGVLAWFVASRRRVARWAVVKLARARSWAKKRGNT